MASKINKKTMNPQVKSKTIKNKVTGSKAKAKSTLKKALVVKEKKTHPAPITEPGYSLYSTESENTSGNTWEQDAYLEVLKKLREKKESEQVKSHAITAVPTAHFNERLSSSTPDPEKLSPDKHHFQLIPERDTTHTTHQHTAGNRHSYTNQWMSGHVFPYPALNQEKKNQRGESQTLTNVQMINEGTSQNLNNFPSHAGPQAVSQAYNIPQTGNQIRDKMSNPSYFGNSHHLVTNSLPFQVISVQDNQVKGQGSQVIQTSSEGFVPSNNVFFESTACIGGRRESDIAALQAFIPRDSLGFSPADVPYIEKEQTNISGDSRKVQSGSSGEKSVCSQGALSTPNSSGTDYVCLPTPNVKQKVVENVVPAMQKENGLFQIHAHVAESDINKINNGNKYGTIQSEINQRNTCQQIQSNQFQGHIREIPERDTGGGKLPVSHMQDVGAHKAVDTASVVSENVTPTSQGISSMLSPKSHHGSSMSDYTGSDHFKPHNEQVKDDKQNIESGSVIHNNGPQMKNMDGQQSSSSGTSSQSTFVPTNQLMQPVFLHYTTNGAQIIPVRIGNENLPVQGIHLAGYGLSAPPVTNLGSQIQGSDQNQPLMDVGRATSSVSSASIGSKQQGSTKQQEDTGNKETSPNPWSKVKTDVKLKRVRYLLKELKECGRISKDVEVQRLTKDIEKTLDKIPQLSSTFSLQAEIDLALQPLRSENSQLRRRLRLLNQQLKDQEIETNKIKSLKAVDLDVLHLQGSNTALQKQIADMREDKVKLATEVTELNAQIQRMKIERNKLLASYSEKETEDFRIKQECLAETQKYRDEVEKHKRLVESSHLKHQAAEQESHILQITLQQRDTEISRLQEIVQTMKEGMAELLQELEHSKTIDKSWRENNSFGIQKLVKILEEDKQVSPARSVISDPGRASSPHGGFIQPYKPQQQYAVKSDQTRLTQQALANHDKLHSARADIKISTSDTEAEMTMLDIKENRRRRLPRRRRHSYSPQSQRHSLIGSNTHGNAMHARDENYVGPSQKQNVDKIFHMLPRDYKGGAGNLESLDPNSHRKLPVTNFEINNYRYEIEGQSEAEIDNQSDELYYVISPSQEKGQRHLVYFDQSRYSVTDYFRKYPQKAQKSVNLGAENRTNIKPHRRSLSQPSRNLRSNLENENQKQTWSSSQEQNLNSRDTCRLWSGSQDAHYKQQHTRNKESHFRNTGRQSEIYDNENACGNLRPNNIVNNENNTDKLSNIPQISEGRGQEMGQGHVPSGRNNVQRVVVTKRVQNHVRSNSYQHHQFVDQEVPDSDTEIAFDHMQEQYQNFSKDFTRPRDENETLRKQLHFTKNSDTFEQVERRDQFQDHRNRGQGRVHKHVAHSYKNGNSDDDQQRNRIFLENKRRNISKDKEGRIIAPHHNNRHIPGKHDGRDLHQNFNSKNPPQGHRYGYISSSQGANNQRNIDAGMSKSPQDNLFQGTVLDNSISAIIDDDNVSSVSARTVTSSSTVDDSTFRKGIATLDANILKLQLALQKTKKMLS